MSEAASLDSAAAQKVAGVSEQSSTADSTGLWNDGTSQERIMYDGRHQLRVEAAEDDKEREDDPEARFIHFISLEKETCLVSEFDDATSGKRERRLVGYLWSLSPERTRKMVEPRLYAVDARTGRPLWREGPREMPSGLRRELPTAPPGWTPIHPSTMTTCPIFSYNGGLDHASASIEPVSALLGKVAKEEREYCQKELEPLSEKVRELEKQQGLSSSKKFQHKINQARQAHSKRMNEIDKEEFKVMSEELQWYRDTLILSAAKAVSNAADELYSEMQRPHLSTEAKVLVKGLHAMAKEDLAKGESWQAGSDYKLALARKADPEELEKKKTQWRVKLSTGTSAAVHSLNVKEEIEESNISDAEKDTPWKALLVRYDFKNKVGQAGLGSGHRHATQTPKISVASAEDLSRLSVSIIRGEDESQDIFLFRSLQGDLLSLEGVGDAKGVPPLVLLNGEQEDRARKMPHLEVAVVSGPHLMQYAAGMNSKMDETFAVDWTTAEKDTLSGGRASRYDEALNETFRQDMDRPKLPRKAKALHSAFARVSKHYDGAIRKAVHDMSKPEFLTAEEAETLTKRLETLKEHEYLNWDRLCKLAVESQNELRVGVAAYEKSLWDEFEERLPNPTEEEKSALESRLLPLQEARLREDVSLTEVQLLSFGESAERVSTLTARSVNSQMRNLKKQALADNSPKDFDAWLARRLHMREDRARLAAELDQEAPEESRREQTSERSSGYGVSDVKTAEGPRGHFSADKDGSDSDAEITEEDRVALLRLAHYSPGSWKRQPRTRGKRPALFTEATDTGSQSPDHRQRLYDLCRARDIIPGRKHSGIMPERPHAKEAPAFNCGWSSSLAPLPPGVPRPQDPRLQESTKNTVTVYGVKEHPMLSRTEHSSPAVTAAESLRHWEKLPRTEAESRESVNSTTKDKNNGQ